MAQKLVTIVNPKASGGGTARVSEAAFRDLYEPKGFVLFDPKKHKAAAAANTAPARAGGEG